MSDESFKRFIENRTLADIMEDYGEQRDEWETLLSMEEGKVRRFRHSNGKDFFCEQLEDYLVDEKIANILEGKTVEKQMAHYYVTESKKLYATAYGEITKESLSEKAVPLADYDGVKNLLLKDKILVGAVVKGYYGDGNLLLNKCVCTYYASDNEGSGTKEREDYVYIIFCDKI